MPHSFLKKGFCRALKARSSTAQGEGRKAAEALGYNWDMKAL
jgi:hypothetical protein